MNTTRRFSAATMAALLITAAVSGCTSSEPVGTSGAASAGTPPAAYTGEAVTLTIGTDDSPGVPSADQIQHFAAQVSDLSGGKVTIEPRWHAEGNDHPLDWDQAVAAMVQDGELDLALGPTWAWDVLGVSTLTPLQAPFLVDSDALVAAIVADHGLAGQLMSGLEEEGVVGLSMWPEGLRHPFGFDEPLLEPADYAGRVIRSAKSETIAEVFGALGATTSAEEPNAETMAGMQGEFVLNPNAVATANVTFFPKVNLLYANSERFAALDRQVVRVLADAAATTQAWAIQQTSDVQAGAAFCADGGTVVHARQADIAALQEATAPVSAAIGGAPGNQAIFDAISALKATTDAPMHAAPCASEESTKHAPAETAAALNGTYRLVITPEEIAAAGIDAHRVNLNAGVQTYLLKDGIVQYRLDPTERSQQPDDIIDGTYQVDGNVLTLQFPALENEVSHLLVEVSEGGDLRMTFVDTTGPAALNEVLMASKVWEKIT